MPTLSGGKFTFAIMGDRWGGEVSGWPVFDLAVDEVNLTHPDLVMTVGDLIDGKVTTSAVEDSMWRDFWAHAGRLRAPLFLTAGNHDISNPLMLAYWKQNFGPRYYSFDYGDCHFVVLNTEEVVGTPPPVQSLYLGAEQTAWAVRDLAQNTQARQTFFFMHKPIWKYGARDGSNPDFAKIERALNGRRATFFAGHEHGFERRTRGQYRYFVLGPTGTRPEDPAGVTPESGNYNHYTTVSVERDTAYVAIRRPGNVYREDISNPELMDRLWSAIHSEAETPRGLDGPRTTTAFTMTIGNPFESDTIRARVRLEGLSPDGWQSPEAAGESVVVAPGGSARIRMTFSVPTSRLLPLPKVQTEVFRCGVRVAESKGPIPVFPESMAKIVPEWTVVAPFPIGGTPLDSVAANLIATDPQRAIPGMYRLRGPEGVWNPRATYRDGTTQIRPMAVQADSGSARVDLGQTFRKESNKLAYAVCGVYAPTACTAYAILEANDHADLLVNGAPAMGNRVASLSRGAEYAAVPLKAGWNTLVVRSVNQGANWWFNFELYDPTQSLRTTPAPGRN
jgi:hypothetical protein